MINEILCLDEKGHTLAAFPNSHALAPLFAEPAVDTHCLQYIDPYGDTIFNGVQASRLSAEVGEHAERMPPEVQHHCRQLQAFLNGAAVEPHTFVKFIGD